MTEIPEHLLKRAAERKAQLAAAQGGDVPAADSATDAPEASAADNAAEAPADAGNSKIPAHLLARSAAAKKGKGGEETASAGAAVATKERPAPALKGGPSPKGGPVAAGGGHTQRLLTVVKAGSIQDVKGTPTDKVNVWPHLLVVEFVASLAMIVFLIIFSTFVNAPLLAAANYNLTPNPSKAPWYFLGLQEMLTMWHPLVAGVAVPGVGLAVLAAAGYIDKNPSNKPEDRKFAVSLFTVFLIFWATLVIIGSFFRGEGFNFILPWRQGVHEIFDL